MREKESEYLCPKKALIFLVREGMEKKEEAELEARLEQKTGRPVVVISGATVEILKV